MMRKITALLLCLFICLGFPNLTVSAQNPAFAIKVSIHEPVYLNDTINVQIQLTELTTSISGVEFVLKFDSAFLTPLITQNAGDEMNAFIKASPQNSWEQACRYDGNTSSYILRFSAPEGAKDENTLVKTQDDLLIDIPFTAKAEGETALSIADSSILGVDKDLGLISGKGTEKKFSVVISDKIQLKSTSGLKLYTSGENVYITGIREETPVSELLDNFINTGLKLLDTEGKSYTSKICATGMKICLFSGDTLLDSITLVVKGDLDSDGTVSSVDYLLVKKYILGNITLDDAQIQAGYIGDEVEISALTYYLLKRHILRNYNIYQ
jgi:hypothetical protein